MIRSLNSLGNLVIYRCKVGARLGRGWGKTLGKVKARSGQGWGKTLGQGQGKVGAKSEVMAMNKL